MNIKLHSAVFYSNDINKAEQFYLDLGFELEYKSNDRYLSFRLGDSGRLGIKNQSEERELPGHQTVFLEVENVGELYNEIKTRGLEIRKPLTREKWALEFSILDPDGNKLLFRNKE